MPLVVFTQDARAEATGAHDWYEAQLPGLGGQFEAELDSILRRVEENPLQFPTVYAAGVRRASLRKFPYALFFCLEAEGVIVIACFHASREPEQWQRRVPP